MRKGIRSVNRAEKGRKVSKEKSKVFIIEGCEKIRRKAAMPKLYVVFSVGFWSVRGRVLEVSL